MVKEQACQRALTQKPALTVCSRPILPRKELGTNADTELPCVRFEIERT